MSLVNVKLGSTPKIPVTVVDASGVGVSGLVFNAAGLSAKLSKGAASVAFTLSGANWTEASDGGYYVTLAAGDTDTLGANMLIVTYTTTGSVFKAPFDVRANTEADVFARTDVASSTLATATALGTESTKITAIKAITDAIVPARLDVAVSTRLAATDYTAPPSVAALASQASVDALAAAVVTLDAVADAILASLRADDANALTRATVLTREAVITAAIGAPTTTRVYKWDTKTNYDLGAASSVGRTEYLVTISYHSSGQIATYSKEQV